MKDEMPSLLRQFEGLFWATLDSAFANMLLVPIGLRVRDGWELAFGLLVAAALAVNVAIVVALARQRWYGPAIGVVLGVMVTLVVAIGYITVAVSGM